ncbi:MAG TPA: chromate resistance protein ChrB domain-containing protein [Pyrinomonadaceae bacterium]
MEKPYDLPRRLFLLGIASLSILSLLIYFLGLISFRASAISLLAVEITGIVVLWIILKRNGDQTLQNLLVSGLWAGALATFAYDLARIPIAHAGVPVFKAISYFGTVLVGVETPTTLSESLGWAYHLSNGVSFGLMYAALVRKPRVYSAVIWGLTLEAIMLLTPYAEVFGYRRDAKFLAITIGAHAVYGLVLWLALRLWASGLKRTHIIAGFACVPLGLAAIAADFHLRHANHLPPSPPPYIGPHLYTVWNVPEPDRVVVMWLMKRQVDPKAEFYFIEPFETIRYGKPFDVPEADIRRHGMQSATEFLIEQKGLGSDVKLTRLGHMTHLNEVTPWMLASDSDAGQLTEMLRKASDETCGQKLSVNCIDDLFQVLDRWYQSPH